MKRNRIIAAVFFVAIVALILSGVLYLRGADTDTDGTSIIVPSSSAPSAISESVSYTEPHYQPIGTITNGEELAAAAEVNSDAMGWLEIAGTDIYAPVLQADNNSFYQSHNWRGAADEGGAYYFDSRCYVDGIAYLSPNAIIFGKSIETDSENAGDAIKFSQLERYLDRAYLEENNMILLTICDFEMPYKIVSVGYVDLETDTAFLSANPTPTDFVQTLAFAQSINVHDIEMVERSEDVTNIITLVAYTEDSTKALAVIGKLAV